MVGIDQIQVQRPQAGTRIRLELAGEEVPDEGLLGLAAVNLKKRAGGAGRVLQCRRHRRIAPDVGVVRDDVGAGEDGQAREINETAKPFRGHAERGSIVPVTSPRTTRRSREGGRPAVGPRRPPRCSLPAARLHVAHR